MVFSSIVFLGYFLPIVIASYYLAPCKLKNIILLVSSLFFYAWGEPVYVFLMLFSIGINYLFGIGINNITINKKKRYKQSAKLLLIFAVVINIGLLGFFKYGDFLINNINNLLSSNISNFNLPLPIGISFYTFQTLSYLIDLYKGEVKLQRNLINFGMYVALFPQLIAGPIVRICDVEVSLIHREKDIHKFAQGINKFVIGLAKKVLIANNIGIIWDFVMSEDLSQISIVTAWVGIFAFTMQIYFDFSGYSDMAIGLGKMFGFDFPENFNYPYTSKSITEFWRRWHISLSIWFKEYVYIPLGGNQKGLKRQIINIFIVWILTGLWHGASWNFVVWGLYFGIILMLEKMFLKTYLEKAPAVVAHTYSMILIMLSWVIFATIDFSICWTYIQRLLGIGVVGIVDQNAMYLLSSNLTLIFIAIFGATEKPKYFWNRFSERIGVIPSVLIKNIGLIFLLVISIAFVVASSYNPFLYFRF